MDLLLNWIVGFIIWFFLIVLLALFTWLITEVKGQSLRGKIPDNVFNYKYRPDFIPKDAYLLDTHTHTIASDGWMTPEQVIKWHIANGYNAFVLTDHNTGKNNEPMLKFQSKYPEIVLIPGYEWTTARIHLNFLGIKNFPDRVPLNPSDEDIKNAIKTAKKMGAVVQCDHISWTVNQPQIKNGSMKHPTRDELVEWGVDGFEINNEMRWYDPLTLHWLENKKQNNGLSTPIFISTGTDVHNPIKEWATGWTELLLTDEERKNPSWDVIKRALLEARTRIWVDHDYREPPESKLLGLNDSSLRRTVFAPFFTLAYGIEKIPGGLKGILSHVLWFLLAYFPLRLIFLGISML